MVMKMIMTDWGQNNSRLMKTEYSYFEYIDSDLFVDVSKSYREKDLSLILLSHDIILLQVIQQKFYDSRCTNTIYCISN